MKPGLFGKKFYNILVVIDRYFRDQKCRVQFNRLLDYAYTEDHRKELEIIKDLVNYPFEYSSVEKAIGILIGANIQSKLVDNKFDSCRELLDLRESIMETSYVYTGSNSVYISTGLDPLDSIVKGFKRGEVWCFIGATGIGKTLVMIDLFQRIKDYSKVYISIADSTYEDLRERVSLRGEIIPKELVYDFTDRVVTPLELENIVMKNRYDFVFLDYATEMITGTSDDYRFKSGNLFEALKRLSRHAHCCVITAIQATAGSYYGFIGIEHISEAKVMVSKSCDQVIGIGKDSNIPNTYLFNVCKKRRPQSETGKDWCLIKYNINEQRLEGI